MNNETSLLPDSKVSLSPEIYKSKIVLALTKAEVALQSLHNQKAMLIVNEDHLNDVASFINKIKEAEKLVEAERVKLKEPALKEGNNIDAGAKALKTELELLKKDVAVKYNAMCQDIEKRRQDAEKVKQEKERIKKLIDDYIMKVAQEIAGLVDIASLTKLQQSLGLEKTRKQTYGDQLPDLIARIDILKPLLDDKKTVLQLSDKTKKDSETALNAGQDELYLQNEEKLEDLGAKVNFNNIQAVETALSTTNSSAPQVAEEIYPEIKAKRRTWEYSVEDIALLYKKNPELVELIPNHKAIKELMKKQAEDKTLKAGTVNGLTFSYKSTY